MSKNILKNKPYPFAIKVVKLAQFLIKEKKELSQENLQNQDYDEYS